MLEIEAKFHVVDLIKVAERLILMDAALVQPRHFEHNQRFDTPDRSLSASGKVLRLRQAQRKTLTYKELSGQKRDGLARRELEVEIGDLGLTAEILNELGYIRIQSYDKYRTTYSLHDTQVMLDELPFAGFVEIEGPDVVSIQELTASLGLNWGRRIEESYLALFNELCKLIESPPNDLTFSLPQINFPPLDAIGVLPADRS